MSERNPGIKGAHAIVGIRRCRGQSVWCPKQVPVPTHSVESKATNVCPRQSGVSRARAVIAASMTVGGVHLCSQWDQRLYAVSQAVEGSYQTRLAQMCRLAGRYESHNHRPAAVVLCGFPSPVPLCRPVRVTSAAERQHAAPSRDSCEAVCAARNEESAGSPTQSADRVVLS